MKPLKIFCFFLTLFLISQVAIGQENLTFNGIVLDSVTNTPLSFAIIKIEKGGKVQAGVIGFEDGKFKIESSANLDFIITVDYLGYISKTITIKASKESLSIGKILLAPLSQLLDKLIVSGLKPNMLTSIDKQSFKADQFEAAKGGTAVDILKNLPSVMVNAEGEITVRGSKGFIIMINGKPSAIDPANILSQIPANTIDKIEIMSVPSARYEADGKAGIINIITKKGASDGLTIYTNIQYGLPSIRSYYNEIEPQRYGVDATVSYKKNKLEVNAGMNYLRNDIAGQRVGDAFTLINGVKTSFPSEGERSFKRLNYGFRTNATYDFNSKNQFSAGLFLGYKEQYRKANIFYNNQKERIVSGEAISAFSFYNPNLVLKAGDFQVYSLDYLHKFEDKSSISFSGLLENALLNGYTKNRNLNIKNYADTIQYTLNNAENPLNASRFKVDYEKPLGVGKISMGYQFRTQDQVGSFEYLEKSGNNQPFTLNPEFSADIKVDNKIHALYAMYGGVYKKTEFSGGLRYENSLRTFIDNKSPNRMLHLSNFFPSANFLYNLGNDWRLKAGYSRRVQRSTNNELNPYPEREHSETLEQGDPNIRPEFIGVSEVGLTKDTKKASYYWNIYHQHITDLVNRVNSVYNDTILNRIYTNAGIANLIGTEIGINWNLNKNMKLFAGGNLYKLKINGSLFENSVLVSSSGWVYSLNSNLGYKITPTLSTQFNVNYISAKNTAQGEDSRFYQPNLSIKKTLLNGKMTGSIQWQNMSFGKMGVNEQRISTFGTNFYSSTNYIQETNIVMINISYNFNQKDRKIKLPTSEFGEKEF